MNTHTPGHFLGEPELADCPIYFSFPFVETVQFFNLLSNSIHHVFIVANYEWWEGFEIIGFEIIFWFVMSISNLLILRIVYFNFKSNPLSAQQHLDDRCCLPVNAFSTLGGASRNALYKSTLLTCLMDFVIYALTFCFFLHCWWWFIFQNLVNFLDIKLILSFFRVDFKPSSH